MTRRGVISVYIILVLITGGFVARLVVEDEIFEMSVEAAVIYVDDDGQANYTSIQAAIDNASSGDTIYVWAGTYNELLKVNKTINLIGNGSSNTTVDAKGTGYAMFITSNWVNVSGFKVNNSVLSYGGITVMGVNNCSITNTICTNNYHGILLYDSFHNVVENNTCKSNIGSGIWLVNSDYNQIINNNCNNNTYNGIQIRRSNYNLILNCTFDSNNQRGFDVEYSRFNNIFKNNFINGKNYFGVTLTYSENVMLINTTMENCSIMIYGEVLNQWNTHSIDTSNTINSKPIYYYKNQTDGTVLLGAGQVILANCSGMSINNQTLNNISVGILIGYSSNNTISDNICNNNLDGINCYGDYNIITNNDCNSNSQGGISVSGTNNIIKWNNCSSNVGAGISLEGFQNRMVNNRGYNNYFGLYLDGLYNNVTYNIFSGNSDSGIKVYNQRNQIYYNICTMNGVGIKIQSANNTIIGNNCSRNGDGIAFWYWFFNGPGNNNILYDNNCNNNSNTGIIIRNYHNNTLKNNTCSNNKIGLHFENTDSNQIFENNILKNSQTGMYIHRSCHNNNIYYNNFIDNANQEDHDLYNFNYWNNSEQEGNYWSDYTGEDLPKGWNAPDGIGDTEVPHRNLDYSPFMVPYGWRYPVTPGVAPESYVKNKGNYTVDWYPSPRSIGYIMEEDDNSSFNSPSMIYKGINTTMQIRNKTEGFIYYRVRSYSAFHESDWSNTWTIIVDFTPPVPKDLVIEVYPDGEVLNLTWNLNEKDTIEYEIWYNSIFEDDWTLLDKVKHPNNTYYHTGLQNSIKYEYKLRAVDSRKQFSAFSKIVSAIPRDTQAPNPPKDVSVKMKTVNSVTLIWSRSKEADVEGYNIYRSTIPDPIKWGSQVGNTTIGNEQFINFELDEYTTYYYAITAFDEVPNESNSSIIINVTTLPKQRPPEINHSIPDFEIPEDSFDNSTINLFQWFSDVNNDTLNFSCLGKYHINVTIFPDNGSVLLVPEHNWNGREFLVFAASDGFETVSDEVMITVTPVNDPPENLTIVAPRNNEEFEFNRSIILQAECFDVDLVYGDELTFIWLSNISGELGEGNKLDNIILPKGNHSITVEVWDSGDEYLEANVDISIFEIEKPPINDTKPTFDNKTKDEDNFVTQIIIATGVIAIILVIIIIAFLLLQRKKKKKLQEEVVSKLKVSMVTSDTPDVSKPELELAEDPGEKSTPPQEVSDTPTTTTIPKIEPKVPAIVSKSDKIQIPPSLEKPLLPPKEEDENDQEKEDADPEVGA